MAQEDDQPRADAKGPGISTELPFRSSPSGLILPPATAPWWWIVATFINWWWGLWPAMWTVTILAIGVIVSAVAYRVPSPQGHTFEVIQATVVGFALVAVLTLQGLVSASGGFARSATIFSSVAWLPQTLSLNLALLVAPLVNAALLSDPAFLCLFPTAWGLLIRAVIVTALYNSPSTWIRHLLARPAATALTAAYQQRYSPLHLPYVYVRPVRWPVLLWHLAYTELVAVRHGGSRHLFSLVLANGPPRLIFKGTLDQRVARRVTLLNNAMARSIRFRKIARDELEWRVHIIDFMFLAWKRGDIAVFRDAMDALDEANLRVARQRVIAPPPGWLAVDGRLAVLRIEDNLGTLARAVFMEGDEFFWQRLLVHARFYADSTLSHVPSTLLSAVRHAPFRKEDYQVVGIYANVIAVVGVVLSRLTSEDDTWVRLPPDDDVSQGGVLTDIIWQATKALRMLPASFRGEELTLRQVAIESLLDVCLREQSPNGPSRRQWFSNHLDRFAAAPVAADPAGPDASILFEHYPPLDVARLGQRLDLPMPSAQGCGSDQVHRWG